MKITISKHGTYLYFDESKIDKINKVSKVAKTIEMFEGVYMDFNDEGDLLGIEFPGESAAIQYLWEEN